MYSENYSFETKKGHFVSKPDVGKMTDTKTTIDFLINFLARTTVPMNYAD